VLIEKFPVSFLEAGRLLLQNGKGGFFVNFCFFPFYLLLSLDHSVHMKKFTSILKACYQSDQLVIVVFHC
jgi:hypothetical protein